MRPISDFPEWPDNRRRDRRKRTADDVLGYFAVFFSGVCFGLAIFLIVW